MSHQDDRGQSTGGDQITDGVYQLRPRRRAASTQPHETLPGEDEPLVYNRGRTSPISPQEALGVARRAEHKTQSTQIHPAPLTTQLPSADADAVAVLTRLPPLAVLYARARAEIEGTTVAAILTDALIRYAGGIPDDPSDVQNRHELLLDWFRTGFTSSSEACEPEIPVPAALLSPLQAEARRRGQPPAQLLAELLQQGLETPRSSTGDRGSTSHSEAD